MEQPFVFVVPALDDKYLVYAPLHRFLALVDRHALRQIRQGLTHPSAAASQCVQPILDQLRAAHTLPLARTGPLGTPLFLGIIPTRGCNMACRYCDFAAPKRSSPVMSLDLARASVNAYLNLLHETSRTQAEIHFFGGEPFIAENVVHFVVSYARLRAAELGLPVRFEAITNGFYNRTRCRWIADHFDTIVLSMDGPADIHDAHRPAVNDHSSFAVVARNAHLFSESDVELILRVCVTSATVERIPEIAAWIANEFRPSTVCLESLTPSSLSRAAGMAPPDPWTFAHNFDRAAQILASYGIRCVLSTADLSDTRASFCPVGKDALIISPDGGVDACYLLEDDWLEKELDMRLGHLNVESEEFALDPAALQRVRSLNLYQKPLCARCLCRYHCAGGCHVNHDTSGVPGQYTRLCILTRLVTIATLLRQMDQDCLAEAWFSDRRAMEASVWQQDDRLLCQEKSP